MKNHRLENEQELQKIYSRIIFEERARINKILARREICLTINKKEKI